MIEGVVVKRLRVIPDERVRLMEILRCDDEMFTKFGQVYMTTTYPQVIKGWHYHLLQDDNIAVVKGMLKVVLFDRREGTGTQGEVNEFFIGEHNPLLIHVPRGICHGWKCISETEAIVINTVTEPYNYMDPDEHRLPHDTDMIPYDWNIRMG